MRASSCTSSSRAGPRRAVALLLGTAAGLFLAGDAALRSWVDVRTDAERFIDTKPSKIRHMDRRLRVAPDGVVAGSSRVLYQVSTALLAEEGIRIYNLGVSGTVLADLPSLVSAAADHRPRWIAVATPADALARPLERPRPLWRDVVALAESGQRAATVSAAAGDWLRRLHALQVFRASVYERLAGAYHRIGVRGLPDVAGAPPRPVLDCTPFDLRPAGRALDAKCRNGDAVLVGSRGVAAAEAVAASAGPLHPEPLALLRWLRREASERGTRLLLVLEPVPGGEPYRGRAGLERALGVPVLDFTDLSVPRESWADARHLNREGRAVYSRALAVALRDAI